MKNIYKFFELQKPLGILGALSQWDNRFELSTGGNGQIHTYDRYEEKYGLHKNIKKDVDND